MTTTPETTPETQVSPGGGTCTLPPPGWTCSREPGHDGACASLPAEEVDVAALSPRSYGFKPPDEVDLDLPSGGFIRVRKLSLGRVLDLGLMQIADAFTPELLADIQTDDDSERANLATVKALQDPSRASKLTKPLNKVAMAAVVCPTVVDVGKTTDEQINVDDIDIFDKLVIFEAAIGEQLSGIKSLRTQ